LRPIDLNFETRGTRHEICTADLIPDERLRLIFICCHPAVAPDSRAALTLRLVCGLTTTEIARAFLIEETALAQRLVRAKRKITDAAVPFELPAPEHWDERLEAVMSTVEVAYSKAHEDALARSGALAP
jgi:RNA polymerase sigma-70 factor, ECF subfamily